MLLIGSRPVLVVTHLFHPVDNLTVEVFLNGDVCHGRSWCAPVPVLLAGREPDHVTRPDFLDRSAPTLRPATACRDDESLTERVRMPCSPRTRLESDAGTLNKCRIGCLKKWIDTYRSSEPLCRSLHGRLRANSLDVHFGKSLLEPLLFATPC